MKKLIVIPTYNEIKNIEELLCEIFEVDNEAHVLIVDDNSPDGKRYFRRKAFGDASRRKTRARNGLYRRLFIRYG